MARYFASIMALVFALSSPCLAAQKSTNLPVLRGAPASPDMAAATTTAAYELGKRYEHGDGVPQSYERALALYCDAARDGNAKAYFSLGWMFLNGRGVQHSDPIAVAWLKKAAEHGVAQALNLLRLMPDISANATLGCPGSATIQIAAPPRIRDLVAKTAQEIGIDAQLVTAVIAVESAFNPRAVSPKNAQGLMQLMPETALRFGVRDPFDERENVRGGATYLRDLLKRFKGDLTLALAAYNAGEGAIDAHGGVPPYQETLDYIKRVRALCACSEVEF